jgi:hypothetical protein
MFAVYRLALRDPVQPPAAVVSRLREQLPGVEVGADGEALVFMAEDAGLGARVRSAVERVCGMGWSEHFRSLDHARGKDTRHLSSRRVLTLEPIH